MLSKVSRLLLLGTMLSPLCGPVLAGDITTGSISVSPPTATDPGTSGISGYLEGFLGYDSVDAYDPGKLFGGAARVNIWTSANTSLQLDAWGDSHVIPNTVTDSSFGAAAHFAWRDPNSYALGGLVSYGHDSFADSSWANIGIDAQKYFGNLTAYGQAGFTFGASGWAADYNAHGFYAMGTLRYFVTPNFAVSGDFGADWFGSSTGSWSNGLRWGAKAEVKPHSLPISAYVAYQGSVQTTLTEHSVVGGIRLLFGQNTLQAMERNGAAFEDQNPAFGAIRPHFMAPY
jgi:hypothetical protein